MKFLADENFDNSIVRGLMRRQPDIDIIRVQDIGLSGADDPTILEWASQEGRVLLTHDVATITRYAYERIPTFRTLGWHKRYFRKLWKLLCNFLYFECTQKSIPIPNSQFPIPLQPVV